MREKFSAEPHAFKVSLWWGPDRCFGRSGTDDLFPIVTSSNIDAIITVLACENGRRLCNVKIPRFSGDSCISFHDGRH